MEPISIVGLIGAAATAAAIGAAQGEQLREGRLPEVLKAGRAGGEVGGEPIAVLAVHVRRVEMLPGYQGGNFTIQVKYGAKSSCFRCRTENFSPEGPVTARISHRVWQRPVAKASAELNSLCLFSSFEPVVPVVRFAVGKKGFGGLRTRTFARASASIQHLSGHEEVELPLHRDSEEIGCVSVAFEAFEVSRQDLAGSLAFAGAQWQQDAYLMTGAVPTVVLGSVVDDDGGAAAAAAVA